MKVFNFTVRYLISKEKVDEVVQLIDAIKSVYDESSPAISDGVIESSVAATVRRCDAKGRLFDEVADLFIAKTENPTVKVYDSYLILYILILNSDVNFYPLLKIIPHKLFLL